jgi:hypothetical protein
MCREGRTPREVAVLLGCGRTTVNMLVREADRLIAPKEWNPSPARFFSIDFNLEGGTDRERYFAPTTARAIEIVIEGSPLNFAIDDHPLSAARTLEAVTRILDPSGNQVGSRGEDR